MSVGAQARALIDDAPKRRRVQFAVTINCIGIPLLAAPFMHQALEGGS
jgi:hypothetical protein